MGNKALSECVKVQKQRKLKEDKLCEAVDTYHNELQKDVHVCKGAHTIAEEFGIRSPNYHLETQMNKHGQVGKHRSHPYHH